MDLVGYAQEVFDRIKDDYTGFVAKLDIPDVQFIPMSALQGRQRRREESPRCPGTRGRRC